MSESRRQLLTIGVFFIVVVVAILLFAANVIGWTLIIPVVLLLFGIWMLALAAMRSSKPQKYERDTFSTIAMGVLLIAVGGAWYLFPINWLYSLILILLLCGVVAVAAAMRRK
jgi:hypothetical protein